MKREYHSSSPPSSPFSNCQASDELEPAPKRPRFFLSSQTPPPDNDDEDITEEEEEEEIITDESIILLLNTTDDSQSEDNDIIEIEQQNDNTIVVVSDSDNDVEDDDDDQGIDITDDSLPSVPSLINDSISSPDIIDVEIVQEELTLMDEEEEEQQQQQQINNEDDYEFLEFLAFIDENTNDDNNNNNNNNNDNELIDLTEDEPLSIPSSPIPSGRKLSVDVQQCPICLETLSHLQRTGVYLIITRCRHVMCTVCSRQLLAISSRCPLCRENVSSTTLMPYCILT